jgi:16S rRNA (cytosine1402-N4)-methyltransferase
VSVLLEESIEALLSNESLGSPGKTYIDATLGLGGHSKKILSQIGSDDILIGIDRDRENLFRAESLLQDDPKRNQFHAFPGSFEQLSEALASQRKSCIDGILYDLGVSSVHYDQGDRGFSIRSDGPLDMRFDRSSGRTAADIIETYSEERLQKIFTTWADEPKSYFIAKAIVHRRKTAKFERTSDLQQVIEEASFDQKSALRVFQALRIEVNDELWHVERSLHTAISLLGPGGRLCVITFHSIEDRLVKDICAEYTHPTTDPLTGKILSPAILKKVTKKPIEPTPAEIVQNPRSRSAKLRILQKI